MPLLYILQLYSLHVHVDLTQPVWQTRQQHKIQNQCWDARGENQQLQLLINKHMGHSLLKNYVYNLDMDAIVKYQYI